MYDKPDDFGFDIVNFPFFFGWGRSPFYLLRCLHFQLIPLARESSHVTYFSARPSQQKIWDQQGARMGFYMGPIWATHMGLGWDLQHGSMWYPHGQTHMGQKWKPYGSYSGFGPSGPCPANLCRIDF